MTLAAALDPALSRGDAQRHLMRLFAGAGIESAALDARLVLCAALGVDHAALVRDPDLPIGAAAAEIAALAARRVQGEPVSRLRGVREFHGLTFAVSPAVLDPRPETEVLVETVLAAFAARRAAPLRILDLGIGSGAILGALLRELPAAFGVGVDKSAAACRAAQRNLVALGLEDRSAVVCGNWTAALRGTFDALVSNPPYIASDDIAALAPEVRQHDPHLALDGGSDGLDAYRALVPDLDAVLAPDGLAAFEVGAGQSEALGQMLEGAVFRVTAQVRDLAGHIRVVAARRANS